MLLAGSMEERYCEWPSLLCKM